MVERLVEVEEDPVRLPLIKGTGPIYLVYSLVFPHPKVGTFTQIVIDSTTCSSAKVVIFTWICTFMRHFLPVKVKMAIFMLLCTFAHAQRASLVKCELTAFACRIRRPRDGMVLVTKIEGK